MLKILQTCLPISLRVKAKVLTVTWKTDPQYRCDSAIYHSPLCSPLCPRGCSDFYVVPQICQADSASGPLELLFPFLKCFPTKICMFYPLTSFRPFFPQSTLPQRPSLRRRRRLNHSRLSHNPSRLLPRFIFSSVLTTV